MLAICDKNGYVVGSIPGLAYLAKISIEDCEKGLTLLESPDKYSRSKENEGRRIKTVEGGWLILNKAKYNALSRAEARKEYLRVKQAEHRAKSGEKPTSVNTCQQNVNKTSTYIDIDIDTDINKDKDKDKDNKTTKRKSFIKPLLEELTEYAKEINYTDFDAGVWLDHYNSNGWLVGKNPMRDWKATVRNWKRRHDKEKGGPPKPVRNLANEYADAHNLSRDFE